MALGATIEILARARRRAIPAAHLITAPLTTLLARDEVIAAIRIPRLGPDARWGHVKFTRKPGDFAVSLAVVVIDPERDAHRVLLGMRNRIPLALGATQQCLALFGRRGRPDWPLLEATLDADLRRSDTELSPFERALHKTTVTRALKQAMS
jgi:CO/xanthine dehydrogenase FAD-binding subunit